MKLFSKKKRTLYYSIAAALVMVIGFQNCSNHMSFEPTPDALDSLDCGAQCPWEYVNVKAGTQSLPALKLFFIVDNSYTMKSNQINLGKSFEKLFDSSNSSNLVPFEVTAYIINTTQTTYDVSNSLLPNLSSRLLTYESLKSLDLNAVLTNYRGYPLSGKIPGDILGYDIKNNGGPNNWTFYPAPVMGFRDLGNGSLALDKGIKKLANEPPVRLQDEFNRRLAILNPDISNNSSSLGFNFDPLIDNESGLCAMARILRDNSEFVSPGDQSAFILVSDENDSYADGSKCIRSYQQLTGNQKLIQGSCQSRTTTFSYNQPESIPGKCTASYNTGYNVKYTASSQQPMTNVTYRNLIKWTYSSPQTSITYSQITNRQYPQTKIKYYLKSCPLRDGVIVENLCTFVENISVQFNDFASNCPDMARKINNQALLTAPYAPVCTSIEPGPRPDCSPLNANCILTINNATTTVLGNLTSNTDCQQKASQLPNALVDLQHQPSCLLTTPLQEVTGKCPANTPGCQETPVYGNKTILVDGDATTSTDKCRLAALVFEDAAIDSTHLPSCELSTPKPITLSKIFNIKLDTVLAQEPFQTLNSSCSSNLRQKILDQLATKQETQDWPQNGSCTIIEQLSESQDVNARMMSEDVCRTSSLNLCTADTLKKNCSFTHQAALTRSAPRVFIASEDLLCTSPCTTSKTNICRLGKGGPQLSDIATIQDYFMALGSTSCEVSGKVNTIISSFDNRLESDKDNICQPYQNAPTYLLQNGPSYYSNDLVIDYVSHSLKQNNVYKPKDNLSTYIRSRSQELFDSGLLPIITTFVRRTGEPTGTGGSTGKDYEQMVTIMGGQNESVQSNDYSPALIQLGKVLKDRLQRSFTINKLSEFQKIRRVQYRAKGDSEWRILEPTTWSSSGKTVTFNKLFIFNIGDEFRIEYY